MLNKSNFGHIRYLALMPANTPESAPPVLHRSLLNRLRYKHLHMLVALGSSLNLHRASLSRFRLDPSATRSEEHTSELQSQSNLVCRLLLEKKKKTISSSLQKASPQLGTSG